MIIECFDALSHISVFYINERPDNNKMLSLLIDYLKALPWDFFDLH